MKIQIIHHTSAKPDIMFFPKDKTNITLGRSEDSDILLSDRSVSRHHAEISFVDGLYWIKDLNSRGGTKVNDQQIKTSCVIKEEDSITIGTFKIALVSEKDQSIAETKCKNQEKSTTNKALPLLGDFQESQCLYSADSMKLKNRIHTYILEKLNLPETALKDLANDEMIEKLEECLDQTLRELRHELPNDVSYPLLRQALLDELIGYGPISPLLRMAKITEIMINGPDNIFVESAGILYKTGIRFHNEQHLISILQRIVEPLGRHVDAASPMVDARLPDGSRVNAIIPPLAIHGSAITIRKFPEKKLTTDDLIAKGSLTKEMGLFLQEAVRSRQNILVSGGTGSGKTTLLNILSLYIPDNERIITIEDSAELKLTHENLVSLEARPANIEGQGKVSIRVYSTQAGFGSLGQNIIDMYQRVMSGISLPIP